MGRLDLSFAYPQPIPSKVTYLPKASEIVQARAIELPKGRIPKPESWTDYWVTVMHPALFYAIALPLIGYGAWMIVRDRWDIFSNIGGMILAFAGLKLFVKRANGEDRRHAILNPSPPPAPLVRRTSSRAIARFLSCKMAAELWAARIPVVVVM